MYIWVGINVDSQLGAVSKCVREIEKNLGYANFCYTLPMHISLKISFPVPDGKSAQVLSDITEIFNNQEPFEIRVSGLELYDEIAWIRMSECDALTNLSKQINMMLFSRHGVPLHEYDTDYKFHSTLFMGNDNEVKEEFFMLGDTDIPDRLVAHRFVIGFSHSGQLGTYSVLKEIVK